MAGIFTFAAVDCDDQQNRGLCQEFGIQGFPTLKFMKSNMGKVDVTGTYHPLEM
jgi:protein disulfide-isomerase A6